MKVRLVVSFDAKDVRLLQRAGRLSKGSAHAALKEELEAVLAAHIEDLGGDVDLARDERKGE